MLCTCPFLDGTFPSLCIDHESLLEIQTSFVEFCFEWRLGGTLDMEATTLDMEDTGTSGQPLSPRAAQENKWKTRKCWRSLIPAFVATDALLANVPVSNCTGLNLIPIL